MNLNKTQPISGISKEKWNQSSLNDKTKWTISVKLKVRIYNTKK